MNAFLAALCTHLSPPPPRRVLVAALLSPNEVVLNIGTDAGAYIGEYFELLDDGIPITYEGEYLGTHQRPSVVVTVIEAQERLVVARLPYTPQFGDPWAYRRPRRPALPEWVGIGSRAMARDKHITGDR